MTEFVDIGARCSSHVGEAFPVRCVACEEARKEASEVNSSVRNPGGMEPWALAVDLPDPWAREEEI